MKTSNFLFTSESVTEGHPDKVADQISDHILDKMIEQDKKSRVACETLVTTGMAIIAGEITTEAYVDLPDVVRDTIKDIGYKNSSMGFDWETCAVISTIDRQSADIAMGVNEGAGLFKEQGAGDQGLKFGYACKDTLNLMPMHFVLVLVKKICNMEICTPDCKKLRLRKVFSSLVPVLQEKPPGLAQNFQKPSLSIYLNQSYTIRY